MLVQLRIVDFAIIDQLELQLGPGLTALTGETGAGKSIIVGAVSMLRGGRASPELVRSGSQQAEIEAIFDLSGQPDAWPTLEEAGIGTDSELLVRRVIPTSGGRGRVYINGSLATLAMLSRITSRLLDISGQNEHQSLSDRVVQLRVLDDLAGARPARAEVEAAHAQLCAAGEALARLRLDGRQRVERIEFLRYQLDEIAGAELRVGEADELAALRARLQRSAELLEAASRGDAVLYGDDGSVCERLAGLQRRLEELSQADPRLAQLAQQLEEARVLVEDAATSLRSYAQGVDLDPARLGEVEDRLELLRRLARKHSCSVDELAQRATTMTQELDELDASDTRVGELEGELASARRRAEAAARRLSAMRERAARRLEQEAGSFLASLRLEGARLVVELSPLQSRDTDAAHLTFGERRLGPEGWDRVEILLSANPGEPPRPLAKVASGGELSRVMLALRQVVGRYDPLSTSIYDEVDAGIGGETADVVGRCLADVARHRQVLCVTHLPQVAAYADVHLHVGKRRAGRRTITTLESLSAERRVQELARMLGASRVTAQARANAEHLLSAAKQRRKN